MSKQVFPHSPWLWALLAALAAIAVSVTPQWQLLERKGFDLLSVLTAPDPSELPIVIVGIDEPSFADLDLQWPWPRGLHAALVDQLKQAGAAVIAFDVIFADPSDPQQDERLAQSIRQAGNVLLAGDVSYLQTARYEQLMRIDPLAQFLEAGAVTGIARIDIDPDLVVRALPQSPESLWRQVLRLREPAHVGRPAGTLLRYWSPDPGFRYVSYYQALNADSMLPPGFFRDRIVLIGLHLASSPDPEAAGPDMFATPFLGVTGLLTSGVRLHANFVADGLSNRAIVEVPPWGSWLAALGLVLLVTPAIGTWRPLRSLLPVIGLAGLLAAAAVWLFGYRDLWLPVGCGLLALLLLDLFRGAAAYLGEVRQRKAIRRSFEHYVAPAIVQQLIDEPERLRLSGEYFDTTVVFTDLVGFTSLTEKMEPMQLRGLLTGYFTRMVDEMLANNGTLDKFIGDAMMCFFGVPIETREHPLQAVRTAWGMKRALAELNREWASRGLPEFGMRIGVHSGRVVAGNMGTATLFNYTVMGDCVNTGSRLEGANKFYGTEIIVGDSTEARVRDEFELRKLDVVRVKGKDKAITIYELLGPKGGVAETSLASRSAYEAALQHYLEGRFEEAQSLFRRNATVNADAASTVLADRCRELAADPPTEWQGVHTWTSK